MRDSTLINIILDRSGSMGSIANEVVGMFNHFIDEQKELPGDAEVSLIQFDNEYQKDYVNKPIKTCEHLILNETYKPRGMTALFDAVGNTIIDVGEKLNTLEDCDRPNKVLCIIITDGQENASKKFDKRKIQEMIDHQKTKYNWDFIFLAAGIEAANEGFTLGLFDDKCASFDHSSLGMKGLCDTISSYTRSYRATGCTSMDVNNFKN